MGVYRSWIGASLRSRQYRHTRMSCVCPSTAGALAPAAMSAGADSPPPAAGAAIRLSVAALLLLLGPAAGSGLASTAALVGEAWKAGSDGPDRLADLSSVPRWLNGTASLAMLLCPPTPGTGRCSEQALHTIRPHDRHRCLCGGVGATRRTLIAARG